MSERTAQRAALSAVLVLGVAGCAATATITLLTVCSSALSQPLSAGPAGPLLAVAAGAGALVLARLALCAGLTAVTCALSAAHRDAPGCRRLALRLSPRALRPLTAAVLGGGLLLVAMPATGAAAEARTARPVVQQPLVQAALAAPAAPSTGLVSDGSDNPGTGATRARPTPSSAASAQPTFSSGAALPTPGWQQLPDPGWAPAPPRRAPRTAAGDISLVSPGRADTASERDDGLVVVRRGDCLWMIAARHLGPGASDAEVAAEWPRWWRANRSVVGSDPDDLRPGQHLHVPGGASAPAAHQIERTR